MNDRRAAEEILSPLAIEQHLQAVLSILSQSRDDRRKLRVLADYMDELRALPEDLSVSYFLQLSPNWLYLSSQVRLDGYPPSEIDRFIILTDFLGRAFGDRLHPDDVRGALANLYFYKALNSFYVGDLVGGFLALTEKDRAAAPAEGSGNAAGIDVEKLRSLADSFLVEAESNYLLFMKFAEAAPAPASVSLDMRLIAERWRQQEEKSESNSINTLLVERDSPTDPEARGVISALDLFVRTGPSPEAGSSVHFHNASPSAQNELTELAADALAASDGLYARRFGLNSRAGIYSFSFPEKGPFYSGGSIGAAAGLLAYGSKLRLNGRRTILRFRSSAAVTGKVNLKGELLPVDAEGLRIKIRAAFFSSLRCAAVPEANRREAWAELYRLKAVFPARRMDIVAADRLEVLADDPAVTEKGKVALIYYLTHRASALAKFAAGTAAAAAVLIGISLFVRRPEWHFWKIREPVRAEASGNTIRFFNTDNEVLWKYRSPVPVGNYHTPQDWFAADVNGDGSQEFVCPIYTADNEIRSAQLVCFTTRGKVLWEFKPGKEVRTRRNTFQNRYNAAAIGLIPAFDARGPLLLVGAGHAPWEPYVLYLLDARGIVRGEYWNCGHLRPETLKIFDFDGDGIPEILIGGQNNGYDAACLIVLDPRHMAGASPQNDAPDSAFLDMLPGSQLAYVLLPHTRVGHLFQTRNVVAEINLQIAERKMDLRTVEIFPQPGRHRECTLHYILDSRLRVFSVRASDDFLSEIKDLRASGILGDWRDGEFDRQKDAARYWDGKKWSPDPGSNFNWNKKTK